MAGMANPMSVMSKKVKKYPEPIIRISEVGKAQIGILSIRAMTMCPKSSSLSAGSPPWSFSSSGKGDPFLGRRQSVFFFVEHVPVVETGSPTGEVVVVEGLVGLLLPRQALVDPLGSIPPLRHRLHDECLACDHVPGCVHPLDGSHAHFVDG